MEAINNRKTKLSLAYPWLVILLASLILFYKYLLQVFPSVITDELMQDFHLNAASLGNLAAFFFYSYLISQLFSGYLIDRFNTKGMIIFSVLISATGAFLFAQANTLPYAIVGRTLMGIGAAFATVGYMKTAAIYFPPQKFSLVSGLLTVGVMLGAVFGEAPLALLIKAQGWHNALFYIGLSGVTISLLFLIFVRGKPQSAINTTTLSAPCITWNNVKKILQNKTNWYLTLYSGLAFAPLAVFGGLWGTPFIAKAYHLSRPTASAYVSMVYVGFGIGGPLFGYLADRFQRHFNFMLSGLLLSLISILSIVYLSPSVFGLIVLTILFGLGTGAFMLGFTVGKEINPIFMAATVVAFVNSGDAIFGALSEPFIGKLLDLYNNNSLSNTPSDFPLSAYHIALSALPIELIFAGLFLHFIKNSVTSKELSFHSKLRT